MPQPRKNESRDDWMERCVPFIMKENRSNPQAVAVCSAIYTDRAKGVAESDYGRCPQCGSAGYMRERRPFGNDICASGHEYPSASAIHVKIEQE